MLNNSNPSNINYTMPIGFATRVFNYRPNACADDPIYKMGAAWFAAHRDRWMVIRKVAGSEFNEIDAAIGYRGGILFMPQLWVLVSKHLRLGHSAYPIWRGSLGRDMRVDADGYLACDSDDLVAHHLDVMASSHGVNFPEMLAWKQKYDEAVAIYNAARSVGNGSGKVN
jgi:hypothetical protein